MKTLFLFRHAKSSWEEPGIGDYDRPLLETGIRKTKKVIDYFNKNDITVDLIISSPAVRALETAKMVANGIGYPMEKIRQEKTIYEGHYAKILEIIYGTPNEIRSLMLFGHNPTITLLANQFLRPEIEMLPTSGVACISFKTDKWEEIAGIHPEKEFVIAPKFLK